MLLSILMIVKNEEKFLEDCLQALQPVLSGFPSELIISDTGSTDRTPEIAQKYATKYLEIKWHDDFALARNQGLRHARGKWVCFIDADEMLQDPQPLIDFFRSGEYKKYKSADWLVTNMMGGKKSGSFRMQRAVRKFSDTKFVGAIHEQLQPIWIPRKSLNCEFIHYGYEADVKKEKGKNDRNREEVIANFEKDPNNPIYYIYYIDQLNAEGNIAEVERLCKEGIEKFPGGEYPHAFVDRLSKSYEVYGKNKELIEYFEKYFAENEPVYSNYPQILLRLALAYEKANDLHKAVDAYQEIFDIYQKESQKPFLNKRVEYLSSTIIVKEEELVVLKPILAKLYSLTGNFEKAEPFCKELNIDASAMYTIFAQKNPDKLQSIMDHAKSTGDINNILAGTQAVKAGMSLIK